jgi:membrane protease subunit (stomatin/prohibitin family)
MGIFDFVKNELIDIIEWVEDGKDVMLYKYPDNDKAIKYGAQLTVRESQVALFVNEGQIADVYQPGRHELVTANMPITTTLQSWKYGLESPFKVDTYFASTRQFTNLKWGTPNPIMMRDPEFKQVRIRAFGVYFIRIKDVKLFFKEYAGTAPVLYIADLEESLRDLISPKFAEALAEAQISVLDLATKYSELGAIIAPIMQRDLDEFGLELTKFQITSCTLPEEVEAFYDKMTQMNMIGSNDMNKFGQFQTFNSLDDAAKNPGGIANIGAGIGMANVIAQNMQGALTNQNNQQNNVPTQSRDDIMKTLKDLADLKTAGIVTEAEFEAKKKELLAKL